MTQFVVNDKPAVKIFAKKIRDYGNSTLFDCEGDEAWFPKICVEILDKETILVQEWIYNQKLG